MVLAYAFALIWSNEKNTLHIYLNQFVGNKYLDFLFYYITYLGDGLTAPFILLLLLVYNVRLGICTTVSFLSATLCTQILKHFFFDDVNRPTFIFNYFYHYPIKIVDGVDTYINNSFPSGHATQAFSILMCFAFANKSQNVKLLLFFIALLTSFSRVYLSQHWLNDITAGSMIGMFFSILYYAIFIGQNKLQNLNKPLSALKKIDDNNKK